MMLRPTWNNFSDWSDYVKRWNRVSLREGEDSDTIEVEIPGFNKEEIEITLNNGTLYIRAENEDRKHSNSVFVGHSRKVTDAKLENGILYVTVRTKESEGSKIKIK